jgi:hypothetical protein
MEQRVTIKILNAVWIFTLKYQAMLVETAEAAANGGRESKREASHGGRDSKS